jgi:polysaccharide deacetylase family protein (PEP-CTERM system associated)
MMAPTNEILMRPTATDPATIANGQERSILNALTVDVEDYYQVTGFENRVYRAEWDQLESRVVASTRLILDVLQSRGVRGTFFVLGWVAERFPDLVRAIHAAGHEIGCHGFWHRVVYQQAPEEFRHDLQRARDVLQEVIGLPVTAFRAPCFSITRRSLWALDILIEEGFTCDSSVFPTVHDRYGLPDAPLEPHRIRRPAGCLWEFPLPVYRRLGHPWPIGGGGYLRLYPYPLTRYGLRSINAQGRPFAVYVHPWELDPGQPQLASSPLQAFRHYVNLRRTKSRLEKLLQDFRFGTMQEVLAKLDAREGLQTWDFSIAA